MCRTEPDLHAEDLYKVLGVQRCATDREICAAYKRLALRHHPDKNIGDRDRAEHAFKRVTCAYETLRDAAKRQTYDASLGPTGSKNSIPSNLGSFERADDLYRTFFGAGLNATTNVHDLDIAGIFNFDQKPRARKEKVHKQADVPAHVIQCGKQVVIHGLASKPEHNGKAGKVKEWKASKGRYDVILSCGTLLSVRPQNLTQLCHVTVTDCEWRPELHGKRGEIVDFNEDKCSYVLLLNEPPCVVELPPSSCIFPKGSAGILKGLADEQLNGQMCCIVGIDHIALRYVVQSEGGRQLKVRYEKVLC